jgi:uncharacterized protein involved in oxidation of intracellular sulfur
MKTLFIMNNPPYGTESLYNGLRLALAMIKSGHAVTVFLLADAVIGAKRGQKTPDGFYNIERMLQRLANTGNLLLCGSCMDARGMAEDEILEGGRRSTMDELAKETAESEKVLVF